MSRRRQNMWRTLAATVILVSFGLAPTTVRGELKVYFEDVCPSQGRVEGPGVIVGALLMLVAKEVLTGAAQEIGRLLAEKAVEVWKDLDATLTGREFYRIRASTVLYKTTSDHSSASADIDTAFDCVIVVVDAGTLAKGDEFPTDSFAETQMFDREDALNLARRKRMAKVPSVYAEFAVVVGEEERCADLGNGSVEERFSLKPVALMINGEAWKRTEVKDRNLGIVIEMTSRVRAGLNAEALDARTIRIGETFASWSVLEVGKTNRHPDVCRSWYSLPRVNEEELRRAEKGRLLWPVDVDVTVLGGRQLAALQKIERDKHLEYLSRLKALK